MRYWFSMMRRFAWCGGCAGRGFPTALATSDVECAMASDCFAAQLYVRSTVLHMSTIVYRAIKTVTASRFTVGIISKSSSCCDL